MDIRTVNNILSAIGEKYNKADKGRKVVTFVEKTAAQVDEETRQFRSEMNQRFSQTIKLEKPKGAVPNQIDFGDFKILAGRATNKDLAQANRADVILPKALPPHVE